MRRTRRGIGLATLAVGVSASAAASTAAAAHAGGTSGGGAPAAGVAPVNGATLAYESFGPPGAAVILLVAGAQAQLTMWPVELCQELVRRGYRVVRYDHRDTGRSTHLDALGPPDWPALLAAHAAGAAVPVPYTLADLADDAAGLLAALGIARAHVVGASMGGHVAQRVALQHPGRTRSLTSIASDTGNPEMPGPAEAVLALPPPLPAGSALESILERELLVARTLGRPAYPTAEAVLVARIRRDVERSYDPIALERQTVAVLTEGDRREALRRLRLPTVVLHGDADLLVPVENGYDTAATVPGAELRVVPGLGHDLPLQLVPVIADAITAAAARAAA